MSTGSRAQRAVVAGFVLLFGGVMAGEYVAFRHGLDLVADLSAGLILGSLVLIARRAPLLEAR